MSQMTYTRTPTNFYDIVSVRIIYNKTSNAYYKLNYKNITFPYYNPNIHNYTEYNYETTDSMVVILTTDFRNLSITGLPTILYPTTQITSITVTLKNGQILVYDLQATFFRNDYYDLTGSINILYTFITPYMSQFWKVTSLPFKTLPFDYNLFTYKKARTDNFTTLDYLSATKTSLLLKDPEYTNEYNYNQLVVEHELITEPTENSIINGLSNASLKFLDNEVAFLNFTNLYFTTNLYVVFVSDLKVYYIPVYNYSPSGQGRVQIVQNGSTFTSHDQTVYKFLDYLISVTKITNEFIGIYQLDNIIVANMANVDYYRFTVPGLNGATTTINWYGYSKAVNSTYTALIPTTPNLKHGFFYNTLSIDLNKVAPTRWDKKYLDFTLNDHPITEAQRNFAFYILLDKVYLVIADGSKIGFSILSSIEPLELQNISKIKELQANNISFQNSLNNVKITNDFERRQIRNNQTQNNINLGIDVVTNTSKVASSGFDVLNAFTGGSKTIDATANLAKTINNLAFNNINAGLAQEKVQNNYDEQIRNNEVTKNNIRANNNFSVNNSIDNVINSLVQRPQYNFEDMNTYNGNLQAFKGVRDFHLRYGLYVGETGYYTLSNILNELLDPGSGLIFEYSTDGGTSYISNPNRFFIDYFYFWNWEEVFYLYNKFWINTNNTESRAYIFNLLASDIKLVLQNGFTFVTTSLIDYETVVSGKYVLRLSGFNEN